MGKSFPDLQHTSANAQLYGDVMVVGIEKLGRKLTVPTESWTRNMWSVNPLRLFINLA